MLHIVRRLQEAVEKWALLRSPVPRTVLIPSERLAHAFRRELALRPETRPLLAGTRFTRAIEIARERILRVEPLPTEGREDVLPVALESLLRGPTLEKKLQYFTLEQLRAGSGFAEAIATTLTDLSAAGVNVDRVRQVAAGTADAVSRRRLSDLAAIQESLRLVPVDRHWVLRRASGLPPSEIGAFFALLAEEPEPSELEFLATLSGIETAYLEANPPRPEALETIDHLVARLGGRGSQAPIPLPDSREISLLGRYFLARPEEQVHPSRPSSGGPDGTVHLELHGGVADELAATRDWASEQIRRGLPLERIAILVPDRDPQSGMVYDGLATLPWQAEEPPIHVAGGLTAVGTPAGQRLLGLLDALECGLRVEELARLLPWLAFNEGKHLFAADVNHLVWNCGTIGGSPERRKDGARWHEGLTRLIAHMEDLAALKDVPERLEPEVETAKRRLEPLRAVLPALRDLVAVSDLAASFPSLAVLWPALLRFWKNHVAAFDDRGTLAALDEKIQVIAPFTAPGIDGLRVIRDALLLIRHPIGRYGEPRIFIGTPRDAAGLPFDAVRLIGLAEGAVAGAPKEDPILPDSDRRLFGARIRLASRRPLSELQSASRLVRHAEKSIVLSAPRQGVDGTVREASSIFLEIAAALRRPDRSTGKRDDNLLRQAALRRDYLVPSRAAALGTLKVRPARPATDDIERFVLAQAAEAPGPLDGLLPAPPPGALPHSSSAIGMLLRCPHRHLFERVLHWKEAEELPDLHDLDALSYGNLFHSVMEEFFKPHHEAFYSHKETFASHLKVAQTIGDRLLENLVQFHPLEGDARERARDRLRDDVENALRHEWERKGVQAGAIERSFGYEEKVTIAGLDVHGYFDRIDVEKAASFLRDWKTGKAKDKEDPLDPLLDLQLALYSLALKELTPSWNFPAPQSAGYLYVSARRTPERSYAGGDFAALLEKGREWIDLVRRLAETGSFPRTPDPDDCGFCPFKHVCGPEAPRRVGRKLAAQSGPASEFIELRTP